MSPTQFQSRFPSRSPTCRTRVSSGSGSCALRTGGRPRSLLAKRTLERGHGLLKPFEALVMVTSILLLATQCLHDQRFPLAMANEVGPEEPHQRSACQNAEPAEPARRRSPAETRPHGEEPRRALDV